MIWSEQWSFQINYGKISRDIEKNKNKDKYETTDEASQVFDCYTK